MGFGAAVKTVLQGTAIEGHDLTANSENTEAIDIGTAVVVTKATIRVWVACHDVQAVNGILWFAPVLTGVQTLTVYLRNSANATLEANSIRITWEVTEYY